MFKIQISLYTNMTHESLIHRLGLSWKLFLFTIIVIGNFKTFCGNQILWCGDGVGMGRLRVWEGDGEYSPIVGWGWGQDCLFASPSTIFTMPPINVHRPLA